MLRQLTRYRHTVANSLNVTRICTDVCSILSVFLCNHVPVFYRFWDIQRRMMACPWNLG